MAATTSLTIDDFERLPSEQVENCELVDGELVPMSSCTLKHNSIRDRFIMRVGPYVFERHLGTIVAEQEYDFGGNVHGPDISFFGSAKLPLADPDKRVQRFVPDLAIEIVSANDTVTALWRKKERYRACGTSEVWIVLPESREVSIYAEGGDRILRGTAELSTDLIAGFKISVDELFQGL
ncbi:MAG: Uma2 family endonuclease [Acidobacteriia bacterium]|nr:Uma2 family endonuclease [Terriglobia bacterium]